MSRSFNNSAMDVPQVETSEFEDSMNEETLDVAAILTHADGFADNNEVRQRFLVTKEKNMMAMGATTKYLEVLHDGSVRIRDVKRATISEPIQEPWDVFRRDAASISNSSMKKPTKKQIKKAEKAEKSGKDNLKVYMDGKAKKRYFKFSTMDEKRGFFNLIDELRRRKVYKHALFAFLRVIPMLYDSVTLHLLWPEIYGFHHVLECLLFVPKPYDFECSIEILL